MRRIILIGAILVCVAGAASAAKRSSPFTNQGTPSPVNVTMLAVSSSSRQSFAGNQEIYLADLQPKNGEHRFVRIIDQYAGYALPIRDSVLRNQTLLTMRVTREPECDVPGSQIFLAPADKVIFNGAVRDTLQARGAELVPCYRSLHSTIQIAKVK